MNSIDPVDLYLQASLQPLKRPVTDVETKDIQQKCHFKTQKCNSFGKKGHIAMVCRASPRQQDKQLSLEQLKPQNSTLTSYVATDQTTPDQAGFEINDVWGMFIVNTVSDQANCSIIVELFIKKLQTTKHDPRHRSHSNYFFSNMATAIIRLKALILKHAAINLHRKTSETSVRGPSNNLLQTPEIKAITDSS